MDDSESARLLREIRDLQQAQLDLFREWQANVSDLQRRSAEAEIEWRRQNLTWQKRKVWVERLQTAILVFVFLAIFFITFRR